MAVIKQYVNLPSGVTTHQGPTRQLRVAPNNVPAVAPGDRAEWWVEPDGTSNTNIFFIPPATRNPTSPSGIAGARVTNTQTTLTTTGANRNHFVNTINLPHVGGDNYVVKVSRRNNRPQFHTSDTFQTWRKLFYTVFHVTPTNLAEFNAVEQQFKDAFLEPFVEWENVAKIPGLTQQTKVNVGGNFTTGNIPFMNGRPGAVMNLRPAGTGTLNNKPFHAALLIATVLFETRNIPMTLNNQSNPIGSTTFLHDLHTDASTTFAFILRANAAWTGRPTNNVRFHFAAPVHSAAGSTVTWDLTTVPGLTSFLAGNAARRFQLSFTVVREDRFAGFSTRNFCVARTSAGITDALQTYTHELAHSLGHVVRSERRFNEAGVRMSNELNVFHHTDEFGGQGPHCSTNAVLVPATPAQIANGATSGQIFRWSGVAGQTLCTMFFRSDARVDENGRFCPSCEPRMRRTNMDRASQTARGWNFFG